MKARGVTDQEKAKKMVTMDDDEVVVVEREEEGINWIFVLCGTAAKTGAACARLVVAGVKRLIARVAYAEIAFEASQIPLDRAIEVLSD